MHDLAAKLGLTQPGGRGNYASPHHDDGNPSLKIYDDGFKDFSAEGVDRSSGDCINLVMYVKGIAEVGEAMRYLHELYNIPTERSAPDQPRRQDSREAYVASKCLDNPAPAIDYLVTRGIKKETAELAHKAGAVGYNDWHSPTRAAGEVGHGGPAAAFICRGWETGEVLAVDFRYIDASTNGGVKTQTMGQKRDLCWFISQRHVENARTVYLVESAINALCIESCRLARTAAVAIRGTGNAATMDLAFLQGKQIFLALDADEVNEQGRRPGPQAAWVLYDRLTAAGIAVQMIDQTEWVEAGHNDVADIAAKEGTDGLKARLREIEQWAIPGLVGKDAPPGPKRVFLPAHDWSVYWRFRTKPDFTSYVTKVEEDEHGGQQLKIIDLCGFRVAAMSKITIQSATATMSGEKDSAPTTVFAATVQTPRHGPVLQRRVLSDERLHNLDQWQKLGPIFGKAFFSRLLNLLERTTELGSTRAINFAGLAWLDGKPVVNEGADCYFTEPLKQCPYHNLSFPRGDIADAATVIKAYQQTFRCNAAMQLLAWGLGGHLKAFTGFYPHMTLQARKGSGKSTLIKRLERTIAMQMFSSQSLQSDFRQITSISHTSHPIGWEEISATKQIIIDSAVKNLQESYQFTITRRSSEMTEYVLCAPVLLAGEDVPVKSLTGKLVRCTISADRMGPELPDELVRFPVYQWLQFLAGLDRTRVQNLVRKWRAALSEHSRASGRGPDSNVNRMILNYAVVGATWSLLCEFAGIAVEQGHFARDLRTAMNEHISDTEKDRDPWVWILETLTSEIDSGNYFHPLKFEEVDGEECMILRPQHVIDHISGSMRLREFWNGLPIKSGRVFKQQLDDAGVVVKHGLDKIIKQRRHAHLSAISINRLAEYGLHVSVPEDSITPTSFGFQQAANQ